MGSRTPDSKLAALYYGDLLTSKYVSPRGNVYPGRYYNRGNHKVNRVIVHHMGNGDSNITRQTLLNVFKNRNGSVTYAIFSDGQIVQFLPESVAPWTSSSYDADISAITFEVENIREKPDWGISDAAYRSLVKMLADVCDRYPGIGKLHFDGTKAGSNIHMHKWYSATDCPGPYIENLIRSGKLVADVNAAVDALQMNGTGVIKEDHTMPTFGGSGGKYGEYEDNGDYYFYDADGSMAKSKFVFVREQNAWKYCGKDGKVKKGWWILKDRTGTPRLYFFDYSKGVMQKGQIPVDHVFNFDLIQGFATEVGVEV